MTDYAYQASIKHVHPANIWTLTLNRYQRDNLLWLLNACGYQHEAIEPFNLAHTGDWNGELVNMLGKNVGELWERKSVYTIDENDHPNKSFEQLQADIDRWRNGS